MSSIAVTSPGEHRRAGRRRDPPHDQDQGTAAAATIATRLLTRHPAPSSVFLPFIFDFFLEDLQAVF